MFALIAAVIFPVPLYAASANVCNVTLMRFTELYEGIDVMDSAGNVVGTSKIAAKMVRWMNDFILQ